MEIMFNNFDEQYKKEQIDHNNEINKLHQKIDQLKKEIKTLNSDTKTKSKSKTKTKTKPKTKPKIETNNINNVIPKYKNIMDDMCEQKPIKPVQIKKKAIIKDIKKKYPILKSYKSYFRLDENELSFLEIRRHFLKQINNLKIRFLNK